MKEKLSSPRAFAQESFLYLMLMQCPICGDGVVVKLSSSTREGFKKWVEGDDVMAGNVSIVSTYPKGFAIRAPEHTPENVERFYVQGMDNIAKNFDAAGTMFRKSLDATLRHIDPKGKGTLEKRIESLPPDIGVTPAMKEWAHQIRHLGNDAAHEEDPFTEIEAKNMQEFTRLFLTYVFTLPGMLAAARDSSRSRPGRSRRRFGA